MVIFNFSTSSLLSSISSVVIRNRNTTLRSIYINIRNACMYSFEKLYFYL